MHGADLLKSKGKQGSGIVIGAAWYDEDTAFITEDTGSIMVGYSTFSGCKILAEEGAAVTVGKDCDLKGLVIVCRKHSHVHIGDNVRVHGDFWGKTVIHSKEGCKVSIDSDCLLSGNIVIRNNDGHEIIDKGKRVNKSSSIYIGKHVWIGENTRILKGAHIGNNTIIGSSSVVTNRCQAGDNVILAGNPANVIRQLNTDETWVE